MNNQILQGEKYLWRLPDFDKKLVADVAASYNLSFPIVQTLFTRGFIQKDAIDAFLFTTFERDVAHPSRMKDAQKAVDRILYAIEHQEKILVCGDYDVDGITSSALMMISLLPLGAQVNFFLPHRVRDGYGLSTKIVERAAKNGYKVMITVDNGITAFEPAARAKELGIDLIITDHHRPHDHVPDAFAIVNPNQVDCPYPFKVLAGVGVSFKLLSLLYEMKGLTMPVKAYELLLLGTVADVVPLIGENRFWVRHGLNYVNQHESLALRVLKQNGKVTHERISATDIGFSLAPQINALGRLEDPRQGVGFLIGSNQKEVEHTGKILLELNEARKEIERSIYNHVVHEIENGNIDLSTENVIMAASNKWAPGVIGLVAGRLMNAYGKPALLFHLTKDGLAKGSCRSIPEFNMFDALQANKDLLKSFGGHSVAAGLSLRIEDLPKLKQKLEEAVRAQLTEFDLKQKLMLDASARLSDLNQKFIADLNHLEPFGNTNAVPVFYVPDVVCVQKPQLLKDAHVKCSVFADGVIKPLMFFNRPDLFEKILAAGEESFSVAAQVRENHWNGRANIELTGTDIAFNPKGAS
jgi:single-stranded-DNA-specific exonuclease